jgi:glycosyltransferase involved in cell wall biosynthesis
MEVKRDILVFADGASIHTEKWLQGLSMFPENDIHLVSMNPQKIRPGILSLASVSNIENISPINISDKGGNWTYFKKILKIRKVIKSNKSNIIIAMYLTSYGFFASLFKLKRQKLIHVIMGSDLMVTPNKNYIYKMITKYSLNKADLIISASQTCSEKIKSEFNLSLKVVTQQYGVQDWILDFPNKNKKYTFCSNRAWINNSNIFFILKLLSALPNCSLSLIGDGYLSTNIRKEALKNSKIDILGSISHEQNVSIVASSNFFFSLTNSDGASLSLLEAMAVGSIPIVSNIPQNLEWIIDSVNGFVIDTSDFDLAVSRIEKIINIPDVDKEKIIKLNKEIVSQRGSMTKNMMNFMKLI